jgi:hypothetical protein
MLKNNKFQKEWHSATKPLNKPPFLQTLGPVNTGERVHVIYQIFKIQMDRLSARHTQSKNKFTL